MNIRRLITLALTIICITAVDAQKKLIDEVVAIVGDDAILRSEIEYQYEQSIIGGVNYNGDLKCYIFEQLLIQRLYANQAKIDSISVSDSEVMGQVDMRLNEFIQQVGGQDKLEEYFNKPIHQIRADQAELVRNKLIQRDMEREITKNIKITPSEIRTYFANTPADSIPMISAQYELKQIVLYPEIEKSEIERVKNRLREFQKQVSEGRDFATLAVLYSEDPQSATHGGDLGWCTKTTFVPEFSAVAFNLQEKGKVSKICETEFGYHIIQLLDRKGDRINCRHILLKPKVSAENRRKAVNFLDTISNSINRKEMTFEDAATHFSMDKESRSNGGQMVNPQDGSVKFQISEIPAEIAKAIQGLKEGEFSKPFSMMDSNRDKESYRIVMLCKRHEPHRANMRDDYNMLQNIMEERKRRDAIDAWIRQKQSEIYVSISPEWQNCDFKYDGWVK